MKVSFLLLGSGAARNIGLGFLPDYASLRNITDATQDLLQWNIRMQAAALTPEGVRTSITGGAGAVVGASLVKGAGLSLYAGGDRVTAATAANVVPTDLLALYKGDMRSKGTAGTVNLFSLDTAANATGHFNLAVDPNYVGVGSLITFKLANRSFATRRITAMANSGAAANEVTLNASVPTSEIVAISFKYELYNADAGLVMPAGLALAETANVNVSGKLLVLEAGTFD